MGIYIDPPVWPAHGRQWAHLVSDRSVDELHRFAAAHGIPRRGFERDHYDVPATAYPALVSAGATPVSSREVVRLLGAAGLRRRKAEALAHRAPGNALLQPPRLQRGDLVAVTAPAGPVAAEALWAGVRRLEGFGLRVRVGTHVQDRHRLGYLAGEDADRAADFTAAWMDPEVAGVVCARGGYGTQRLLELLDFRRLAEADPKVLVGFSDVTALHQAFAERLGVVTVLSHVVTSLGRSTEESAEAMRTVLMEPEAVTDLLVGQPVSTVNAGTATGVLVGGNLAMLASEVGSACSRVARGGLVVLEDVDEHPYRLDRMVTQLLRSGWFDGVRGIVLGRFDRCGAPGAAETTLVERLAPLGVPLVTGVDLGHSNSTITVPLGRRATLDAGRGSLRLG